MMGALLGATDVKGILLAFCALLFAAFCYFLKRIIDKQDEVNKKVDEKLGKHSSAMETLNTTFAATALDLTTKMNEATAKVKSEAIEIKNVNLQFQKEMNTDLTKMKQSMLEVENSAHKANREVHEMNEKLSDTRTKMGSLYDSVEAHSRSLGLGGKAIAEVRGEVKQMQSEWDNLKTTAVKLSEALTLITTKKMPKS